MPKIQGRKPPKRKQPVERVDDDLIELISVMRDDAKEPTARALFALPWRDGWNAAMLMRDIYDRFKNDDNVRIAPEINAAVAGWILQRKATPAIYEEAGDLILNVSTFVTIHNLSAAPLLLCALRCVQITIANSSGGGVTYNDLIIHRFDRWSTPIQFVQAEILEARSFDAIGVGTMLQNDHNDRLRRAFYTAWTRGLYKAAYALPQAIKL